MSSTDPTVHIVRTVREFFTVWANGRPVATYWDEGAHELAQRAKAAIESGVPIPGLESDSRLQKHAAEYEAAHWDGGWYDRDPGIPLVDRLLEAAADAGDAGESESMFQLLSIAREALAAERT